MLNVPATCECLSGTDMLRQNYFTRCHTEIEVADQTFCLTLSQYSDTGPTSPSTDPITPGAWQGSHWSASFEVTGMTRPGKIPLQTGFEPGIFLSDKFTSCRTEIEVADQAFCLTQSQYTFTGPTSPTADSITPGT